MNHENQWDKLLQIKTTGRDESRADEYHHPYEPTPYCVLERLAEYNVNILDISQTVMQGYFTMMMVVNVDSCNVPLDQLSVAMEEAGKEKNLSIRVQREDIFEAMHRI